MKVKDKELVVVCMEGARAFLVEQTVDLMRLIVPRDVEIYEWPLCLYSCY